MGFKSGDLEGQGRTLMLWCLKKTVVMLKIYTRVLCADMEYKTLCITRDTTSKELVKHRDPNLFYLTMEVWMRKQI
ncbi:uncharacterized protein LOC143246173 isoform X2 [Tachypleus tridentatus]|uniref:uncharacterized protein LOC143246173 isoform X2 n=1 Tax=Tachypleus tridentatus TaxID=6853 RepID=UPI003FD5E231